MCYTCSKEVKTKWTIERNGYRSKLHCQRSPEEKKKKKEIATGGVNIPSL